MPRSISLLLTKTGGPPSQGSVGYVNDAIAPILERRGWDVRPIRLPTLAHAQEAMLPFGLAALHARSLADGVVDVALYDGDATAVRVPSRLWARKNVMLYHGLAYGAGAWMTNPDIDLHCVNSPYLARVLRALFAFPDWQHRRCLEPRGQDVVTDLRLPLPCIAEPDGSADFSQGVEVPTAVLRQFDSPLVLGHALQPGKQDWVATLSILYLLNEMAKSHGSPRIKLLVRDASLVPERRKALDAFLATSGTSCEDFFVPLPHLNQRALFRVMRSCRFGLAYNKFPEPFGFYVLESVHNGCPVFTNGVGNNRFLLPPGHGIIVSETPAMAGTPHGPPSVDAYLGVAEAIHASLACHDEMRMQCRRGAAVIDSTWSMAAFERSLVEVLEGLEKPSPAEFAFEALEIALSPLVRSLDFVSGRSLNDYASGVLDPAAATLARQLLGQRCGDLDGAEMDRIEAAHGLFRGGILTLAPPLPDQLGGLHPSDQP